MTDMEHIGRIVDVERDTGLHGEYLRLVLEDTDGMRLYEAISLEPKVAWRWERLLRDLNVDEVPVELDPEWLIITLKGMKVAWTTKTEQGPYAVRERLGRIRRIETFPVTCSRCSGELGDDCRINVTMPTVGVIDLCGSCWKSLVDWCQGMKPRRRTGG